MQFAAHLVLNINIMISMFISTAAFAYRYIALTLSMFRSYSYPPDLLPIPLITLFMAPVRAAMKSTCRYKTGTIK